MKTIALPLSPPSISHAKNGLVLLWLISLWIFSSTLVAQPSESPEKSDYLGSLAPAFDLEDHEGDSLSSEDLKGKYIVLHFATTWCPFCNAEAPYLEKLYQEYRDKGVEVMIIDVAEPRDLVTKKLVDRFSLSFPVLFDTDGAVAASFAPTDVLPELSRDEVMLASNLIIDPEGKIVFFSLLDSQNFDAKLIHLQARLNELL